MKVLTTRFNTWQLPFWESAHHARNHVKHFNPCIQPFLCYCHLLQYVVIIETSHHNIIVTLHLSYLGVWYQKAADTTGDVKEIIVQCKDLSVSMSFWWVMASYPVEEGGTIKAMDCNTKYIWHGLLWKRALNKVSCNIS